GQLCAAANGSNGIAQDSDGAVFYPVGVTPSGQKVSAGNYIISLIMFPVHSVLSLPGRAY
ncbi:MAG: hypothetical protein HKP52_10035, partial [Desulfofustis sp.]|nr:hypothetical protein [Desulfofustis sp.]